MIWWYIIIFLVVLLVCGLIIYIRYDSFINEHSILIKNVEYINLKYHFNVVKPLCFTHTYDNETYYNNVSLYDYLVYQLQFTQKEVKSEISKVIDNANKYDLYIADINDILIFNQYDVEVKHKFRKLLIKMEKMIYNQLLKKPTTEFKIYVELTLTNINGVYKTRKNKTFYIETVEDIIERLTDKRNNRFNDERIWQSISRVERAKVSNKMRFAVYGRDNYRCRKCGRKTNDLEIDHIIPIAKGGKTTFDNLQTLCKRCNMEKSDIIEGYTFKTYNSNIKYCPKCKAPLKIIYGKYGQFYGCTNYPKCDYKEKI